MYQIKRIQIIPAGIDTCWEFFMNPRNLERITPPKVRFETLSDVPDRIYDGMMIEYRLRPLLGIPLRWVTEIKCVKEKSMLVDEQRKGPYGIWHHEHHFREVEGGVEMTDLVSYVLPLGFLGRIMHRLFVKRMLEDIFAHRYQRVEQIFRNGEC